MNNIHPVFPLHACYLPFSDRTFGAWDCVRRSDCTADIPLPSRCQARYHRHDVDRGLVVLSHIYRSAQRIMESHLMISIVCLIGNILRLKFLWQCNTFRRKEWYIWQSSDIRPETWRLRTKTKRVRESANVTSEPRISIISTPSSRLRAKIWNWWSVEVKYRMALEFTRSQSIILVYQKRISGNPVIHKDRAMHLQIEEHLNPHLFQKFLIS